MTKRAFATYQGVNKRRVPIKFKEDVVVQTLGLIGRKGSGKTYAMMSLVEVMLEMKARVIAFDPVGNIHGVRFDGRGKPLHEIAVLGGDNGDVELDPSSGKEIARILDETQWSAVLDMSFMSQNEKRKFVTAFSEEFLHLQKRSRMPVHVMLEEAQLFSPQRVMSGNERMVSAIEQIVRLGRNYGIGVTMASQRPQSVNKETLNQVEALFVLQLVGPHERKAVEQWISHQDLEGDELDVKSLPMLKTGEAFLWSPQWLRMHRRVRIEKKKSMDTSKTPLLGAKRKKLKSATPFYAEELKKLLGGKEEAKKKSPARSKIEVKTTKALQGQIDALSKELTRAHDSYKAALERISEAARKSAEKIQLDCQKQIDAMRPVIPASTPRELRKQMDRVNPANRDWAGDDVKEEARKFDRLTDAGQKILAGFYWANRDTDNGGANSAHVKRRVGVYSGYKVGGYMNREVAKLRKAGYLDGDTVTDEGADWIGHPDRPQSRQGMHEWIKARLNQAEQIVMDTVDNQGPIDRETLAAESGYRVGGYFNRVVAKLRLMNVLKRGEPIELTEQYK